MFRRSLWEDGSMPIMKTDDILRSEPGMASEPIESGFADATKEVEIIGTAQADTPPVSWTKVKLLDNLVAPEGWVRTSRIDLQGVVPGGPIDKLKFASQCWVEALFSDANPHYVAAVAEMRSGTSSGQEAGALGPFSGPFRFTQAEWDAARAVPEFSASDFSARDITDWRVQVVLFTLMTHRTEAALVTELNAITAGRRPSAAELYLAQLIGVKAAVAAVTKTPAPSIKEAFDGVAAADQANDRPLGAPTFDKIGGRFTELFDADGSVKGDAAIDRIVARMDPVLATTKDKIVEAGTALLGAPVADGTLNGADSPVSDPSQLGSMGKTFAEKAPVIMRNLLRDFPQLRDFHAAGVLGNIGRETGGFRLMQEVRPKKGRGGLGWLQWTGPRREDFEAFCVPPRPGTDTNEGNYAFMVHEMRGKEKNAFGLFAATSNLERATEIFMSKYERPGVLALEERIDWARKAMNAFQNAPSLALAGGAGAGAGGGAAGGPVVDQLRAQISAGKIIFDKPALQDELLGRNAGQRVSTKLQALVLKLCGMTPVIRISSLVRPGTASHHATGLAVDIGNEEIAAALLPKLVAQVGPLGIDELIFNAAKIGMEKNTFNFDQGRKHSFSDQTIADHGDHIHIAVFA
jgi:hypothetical protein